MLSIDAVDTHETEKPTDRRNESNRVIHRGIVSAINLLAQLFPKEQPANHCEVETANASSSTNVISIAHLALVEDDQNGTQN